MRRVYKYDISMSDCPLVKMPSGAQLLSVAFQGTALQVWALVDPYEEKIIGRQFRIAGTGHDIDESIIHASFTGTAFIGALVFHVFDLGETT